MILTSTPPEQDGKIALFAFDENKYINQLHSGNKTCIIVPFGETDYWAISHTNIRFFQGGYHKKRLQWIADGEILCILKIELSECFSGLTDPSGSRITSSNYSVGTISHFEKNKLAQRDGFANYTDMFTWFYNQYGQKDQPSQDFRFEGWLIEFELTHFNFELV